MNNIFVKSAIILAVCVPVFVHAGPILRSGESVSIDASQILKGDFYGFAPTVTISGPAENDVLIGGGTVTINAPVTEDLTVMGGVVQVHGDVGGDLRIVGGEVTLAKAVKGDVVVVGGTLTVLSTASIEGDVLFMGGSLVVEGAVMGGIHANAETVRINSEIGGDVSLRVKTSFTAGDNANMLGNVQYESVAEIVRAQDATIVGTVRRIETVQEVGINIFKQLILDIVLMFFAVLTVYLTLRKYVEQVVGISMRAPGVSGLVGLGMFILLPFVSMLLLVSVLGSPIGVILFALYVILSIFAVLGAAILCGVYVQKLLMKKSNVSFSTVILGLVSFCLLMFVPVIGWFVIFGLVMVVLGGLSTALYQAIRS
ncbi:MAG: hypothetical protein WAW13_02225 [Minisyncoccia bacterium]